MATRMKTVQFAFPALASLTNNTLTTLTQTTLYLPETGTKTIKKAWVEISFDDIITATGGTLTTKTINLRLGAAGYTSSANANTLTNSGENASFMLTRDFTSHFTTNWTGTSMTCDIQVQINQSTGTTLGMVNVCAIVYVTYEYDDTSTTHIKTVYIPLNAPVTSLPTTKTSHDTIPALDTYLPEASKVYRNTAIVIIMNTQNSTVQNFTISYENDSDGVRNTIYEAAMQTDRLTRMIHLVGAWNGAITHTFNLWSSLASVCYTAQAYLMVTYEFNHTTSTSIMNSIELPKYLAGSFGMTTTNYERADWEFMVQETNPVFNKIAAYLYWNTNSLETTINFRLGTGSFVGYTQGGSQVNAGNKCAMIRNDAPTGATLARGKCKVNCDFSSAHTSQRGWGINGFLLVNYTSDKHANGVGAHNHTIKYPLWMTSTEAGINHITTSASGISVPETNYFLNCIGFNLMTMKQANSSQIIKAEKLVAEGGLYWMDLADRSLAGDTEQGVNHFYFEDKNKIFRQCPQQITKLDLETARRYVLDYAGQTSTTFQYQFFMAIFTYHAITYQSTLTIQNSDATTVVVNIFEANTSEVKQTYSRTGNGDITLIGYDDTEPYSAGGYENPTKLGSTDLFNFGD